MSLHVHFESSLLYFRRCNTTSLTHATENAVLPLEEVQRGVKFLRRGQHAVVKHGVLYVQRSDQRP